MTLWLLIWILLSVFLLGFMGWTLYLHLRQTMMWRAFAQANGLRFQMTGWLTPPSVEGVYQTFKISVFTGEHAPPNERSTQKRTAIELHIPTLPPFSGGLASAGMVPVLRNFDWPEMPLPAAFDTSVPMLALSPDAAAYGAYWTPDRIQAINSLVKIPRVWVIYVQRPDTALLRLDTPLPLERPGQLEKYLQRMAAVARVLMLTNS
ncbi:MAG: hypothetical protein L6Q57_07595 [Alphaproteobacteria bacterium]|nr:hypothetical protein [Alphaproteobacteria bacterium]